VRIDLTFATFNYSKSFIDKFALSLDELKLVGDWIENGIMETGPVSSISPILSISFLPNRLIVLHEESESKEFYSIGQWKVFQGEVSIALSSKLTPNGNMDDYSVEFLKQPNYVSIGSLPKFHLAYYQSTPFTWTGFPKAATQFYGLPQKDVNRRRFLISDGLPSFYSLLEKREDYRRILSSVEPSEIYLKQLLLAMTQRGN
jgi:hypothetical protein